MPNFKAEGEWIAGTYRVKNELTQAAFTMIGLFFVSPDGPRPSLIGLANDAGALFAFQQASWSQVALSPGPGVEVTGVASFAAKDVTEEVHFVALVDSNGVVLAEAPVVPPFAVAQGLRITRRETFTVAP